MRPRIFLSSTIRDLAPIRDALRAAIVDMGYEPVMSEHGEIGFLPDQTAEESCYTSLEQCDVLIAVIGRRYGSVGKDSKSVTQNEVRRARDLGIPVYCFIDHEAATELRMLEVNPDAKLPNFDDPQALSEFVREVITADRSNSIIPFASVGDAQDRMKKQLAHLFGRLLRTRNDTVQRTLSDLLEEVRETRYHLPPAAAKESCALFAAIKFFAEDWEREPHGTRQHYHRLVKSIRGGIAISVLPLLAARTFEEFLLKSRVTVSVMTFPERQSRRPPQNHIGQLLAAFNGPLHGIDMEPRPHYVLHPNLELWIDARVLRALNQEHFLFRRMFIEALRDGTAFSARGAEKKSA